MQTTERTLELQIHGVEIAIDVEVDWEWDDGGWGASSVYWDKTGFTKQEIDFVEQRIDEVLGSWSKEIKREPREPDVWESDYYGIED